MASGADRTAGQDMLAHAQGLQSLFSIIPSQGSLPAGGEEVVEVIFNGDRSLKDDMILPGTDALHIISLVIGLGCFCGRVGN